jgi:hypothetical protein
VITTSTLATRAPSTQSDETLAFRQSVAGVPIEGNATVDYEIVRKGGLVMVLYVSSSAPRDDLSRQAVAVAWNKIQRLLQERSGAY